MVFNFNSDGIQYSSGGEEINNEDITVTSNGTYTAGEGYTGLGTVDVNVADIPATTEALNVTPTTSAQTIRPSQGLDGFNPVNVAAVTSAIDQNISADNIKLGVNILGTTGTYTGEVEDLTSEIIAGDTVDVTDLQDVESDIAAIIPRTLSMTKTITENGTYNAIDDGSNGYSSVTVAVDGEVEDLTSDIINGGSVDTSDLETYEEDIAGIIPRAISMTKTITENGTYTALDDGADGYSEVTVNVAGSGGVGIPREVSEQGVYQMPTTSFNWSLPNTATSMASSILKNAFENCTGLTNADLSSLTTVSSTRALDSAFSGCINLESIDLSGLTTANGSYALTNICKDCTSLENVDLSSLTTLGSSTMQYSFKGCTSLTSVDLSSLTMIDSGAMQYAFQNCTSLADADLSGLITTSANGYYDIGNAFQGCTNLTSVDLSNLTTLTANYAMQYAFQNCTSLTDIDLSNLTTVSGSNAMLNAFESCTSLTNVDLSSLTTVSGNNSLQYVLGFCTGLTSVDLSSLTTVSGTQAMQYAFSSCQNLASVNLNNLKTIGTNSATIDYGEFSGAFNRCYALTSLTFPNLEKIYCTGTSSASYGTFSGNNQIEKMYFPKLDTITYGTGATATYQNACKNIFAFCDALTELHFAADNQAAIEATAGYSTAWGRGAGNVTIYFDL